MGRGSTPSTGSTTWPSGVSDLRDEPAWPGCRQGAPAADLRAYAHDVTQVAACLPRQAVLVGHGAGALVVAMAISRYPARAGVLVAPVFGGLSTVAALIRANPARMVSGLVNETLSLHPRQLFSGEVPSASAREFTERLDRVPRSLQTQLARSGNRSGRWVTLQCSSWGVPTTRSSPRLL